MNDPDKIRVKLIIHQPSTTQRLLWELEPSFDILRQRIERHTEKKPESQPKQRSFIYYQESDRERLMTDKTKLRDFMDVVVRFERDPQRLINRCADLEDSINIESRSFNLMSLSSGGADLTTSEDGSIDVLVMLSSPLVTEETYKLMATKRTHEQLTPFFRKELLRPQRYDKEPESMKEHEKLWGNNRMKFRITRANTTNIKKNRQVKVIQIHCDVDVRNECLYLLLEDPNKIGVEQRIKVSDLLDILIGKEGLSGQLLVIVGQQANQVIEKVKILEGVYVITVNTIQFWKDGAAQEFLKRFYNTFSRIQTASTQKRIQDAFYETRDELRKYNNDVEGRNDSVCCCFHKPSEGSAYKQTASLYGSYTAHLYHESKQYCPQDSPCKLITNKFSIYPLPKTQRPQTNKQVKFNYNEKSQRDTFRRIGSFLQYFLVHSYTEEDMPLVTIDTKDVKIGQSIEKVFIEETVNYIRERDTDFVENCNLIPISLRPENAKNIEVALRVELWNKLTKKVCKKRQHNIFRILNATDKVFTAEQNSDLEKGINSFISTERKNSDVKIFVMTNQGSIQIESKYRQSLQYRGMSCSQFLCYYILNNQKQQNLISSKDEFVQKNFQQINLDGTELMKSQRILTNETKLKDQPAAPSISETIQIDQLFSHELNEENYSNYKKLVKAVSSLPETVTLEEMENRWKLAEWISAQRQRIQTQPTVRQTQENCLLIKELKKQEFRVFKKDTGIHYRLINQLPDSQQTNQEKLEYLVNYTTFLLSLPYKNRNIQDYSQLLECGVFVYERVEEFKSYFDGEVDTVEEVLERTNMFNWANPSADFGKLYSLHFDNIERAFRRLADVDWKKETQRFYHYFCLLALNTIKLYTMCEDLGWQLTNEKLIKNILSFFERFGSQTRSKIQDSYPRSTYILELQFRLIYTRIERSWNRAISNKTRQLLERNIEQLRLDVVFVIVRDIQKLFLQITEADEQFKLKASDKSRHEIQQKLKNIDSKLGDLERQLAKQQQNQAFGVEAESSQPLMISEQKQQKTNKEDNKENTLKRNWQNIMLANLERLRIRFAIAVVEAHLQKLCDLKQQASSIVQQVIPSDKQHDGPINWLINTMTAAKVRCSLIRANALEIRVKFYGQYLTQLRNFVISRDAIQRSAYSVQYKQSLVETYSEYLKNSFDIPQTKRLLLRAIHQTNKSLRQSSAYTFALLVSEGVPYRIETTPYYPLDLYDFESIMRFVRYGMRKSSALTTSFFMGKLNSKELEMSLNCGAEILFLLVDDRIQFDPTDEQWPASPTTKNSSEEVSLRIALCSSEIVVICGKNAKQIANKITAKTQDKVGPSIIAVEISVPLMKAAANAEYKFASELMNEAKENPPDKMSGDMGVMVENSAKQVVEKENEQEVNQTTKSYKYSINEDMKSDKQKEIKAQQLFEQNVMSEMLQRQFLLKFVLTYCQLFCRQPNNIHRKLFDVYDDVLRSYKTDQDNRSMYCEYVFSKITVSKIRESNSQVLRSTPHKYSNFYSVWGQYPTNMKFYDTGTKPTVINAYVIDMYERMKQSHNSILEPPLIHTSNQFLSHSVARLLKYHNFYRAGIYRVDSPTQLVQLEYDAKKQFLNEPRRSISRQNTQGSREKEQKDLPIIGLTKRNSVLPNKAEEQALWRVDQSANPLKQRIKSGEKMLIIVGPCTNDTKHQIDAWYKGKEQVYPGLHLMVTVEDQYVDSGSYGLLLKIVNPKFRIDERLRRGTDKTWIQWFRNITSDKSYSNKNSVAYPDDFEAKSELNGATASLVINNLRIVGYGLYDIDEKEI